MSNQVQQDNQSEDVALTTVLEGQGIDDLGQNVVSSMATLRELLEARAAALESCRLALEEHNNRLIEEREELARHEAELCETFEAREAELADRENRQAAIEEQVRQLEIQEEALAAREDALQENEAKLVELATKLEEKKHLMDEEQLGLCQAQEEWQHRMSEVSAAHASLASLQHQLEGELTKMAAQKDDLLPKYGVSETGASKGEPASQGVPSVAEQQARESMERFQKLCRDAKRRANGG